MPESLVFVPFEYLGGAAASQQWLGRATAAIVARQTSSLASASVRDAQNDRTQHVVEGYVSGGDGALQARVTVRDEATQRTVRSFEARGANVIQLASALAGQMVAHVRSYLPDNKGLQSEQDIRGFLEHLAEVLETFGRSFVELRQGQDQFGQQMAVPVTNDQNPLMRMKSARDLLRRCIERGL
jgi:hypothetical protein